MAILARNNERRLRAFLSLLIFTLSTATYRPFASEAELARKEVLHLLNNWTPDNLRELARQIPYLPDATARHVLWLAATAPADFDTASVYASAFRSASQIVKLEACEILIARGNSGEMRPVLGFLASERDAEQVKRVISAITRQPFGKSVPFLISVVEHQGMPQAVIVEATEQLRNITKERFPPDPNEWRNWWSENSSRYQN